MENIERKNLSQLQKRKVLYTVFFGVLGSQIFSFGLSLLILEETGSAMDFSFSLVIGPILTIIMMPFVGGIVDKYDRKKIVILAQILAIIGLVLFAGLYLMETLPKLYLIYGVIIVQRITDILFSAAYLASISQLVDQEDLLSLNASMSIIESSSMIISLAFGAIIYSFLSFHIFVLLEFLTEIIALVITLSLNFKAFSDEKTIAEEEKENPEKAEEEGLFAMFKTGLAYVYQNTSLLFVLIVLMLFNFFASLTLVGFPVVIIHGLKMGAGELATIRISLTVGYMLMGIFLARKKDLAHPLQKMQQSYILRHFFYILWGVVIYLNRGYWLTLILLVITTAFTGASSGMIHAPANTWIMTNVPKDFHGRVFNFKNGFSQLLSPISIVLFGFLFDHFPAHIVVMASGSIAIILQLVVSKGFKMKIFKNTSNTLNSTL